VIIYREKIVMKKIFEKHETLFCILLIIAYIIVNSYCIQNFGIEDYRSTIINTIFSIGLIILMIILKRTSYYGLTKVTKLKEYLYFIPLTLIVSVNLWNGININNSASEIIFYILTMINIGFIEEIIFRDFLFKMMVKDNVKMAIIVSAVTFGIGHIVNLLNGAELIPTLMQMCYAISIGYLFVIIFYKSKSLIPCIITHCLVNSLSIFNIENAISLYISSAFLIIVPLVYAIYINKKITN
jgi:membrane protease YdiL (CAAX protease family)